MLLPMMGFFLALLAFGGLGSVVATADPTARKYLPYTMAMLFASIGVFGLVFGVGFLVGLVSDNLADTLPFFGIPVGAIGGAVLGYVLGKRRYRNLNFK